MRRCLSGALLFLLLAPCARAAEEEGPIKQAIDRGVVYLKGLQQENGTWPHPKIGATALAGLTLLECDVSPRDPAVRKAAKAVRQASLTLDHTYSLALAILFLDRLGDPGDVALIESMAVRLLDGQNGAGGWTYQCPALDARDLLRLTEHLKQREDKAPDTPKRGPRTLPIEIQNQLKQIQKKGPRQQIDDNSNTQFAVLALWVARRHDLPVEAALARVDQRYRKTQNIDGGWGYTTIATVDSSTMSMTCAGLLGLAVGFGAKSNPRGTPDDDGKAKLRDPSRDPVVRAGLLALGTAVGSPSGQPLKARDPDRKGRAALARMDNYFLWSLERVALAYGLSTLGKKDWYTWGAETLLDGQEDDGSWQGGRQEGGVNTCFALLFLRRANLVRDLSASLKGQISDPGEVTLRDGGVGGVGLKKIDLKPGKNPHRSPGDGDGPMVQFSVGDERRDVEIARLTGALTRAENAAPLIDTYKRKPGLVYTQALAEAIYKLEGQARAQAREALAERLVRMQAETLRQKLRDEDPEIRAAAALACAMKVDRPRVPELIALLDDPVARVRKAAHAALQSLAGGKDLGPTPTAGAAERAKAIAAWKAWWNKENQP